MLGKVLFKLFYDFGRVHRREETRAATNQLLGLVAYWVWWRWRPAGGFVMRGECKNRRRDAGATNYAEPLLLLEAAFHQVANGVARHATLGQNGMDLFRYGHFHRSPAGQLQSSCRAPHAFSNVAG